MNQIPISPNTWELAAAILTPQQLTALQLRERHGFSWNQTAIAMNKTRSTVKEHHRAATKNLLDAIEAASGDIDLALQYVGAQKIVVGVTLPDPEPRPASEETPEEKEELDRLWAETRPASERTT